MESFSLLLLLGLLLLSYWLWPGAWRWFGRLPGDVRLEREGFRLYVPITSMLLVSLLLSLLVSGAGWLVQLLVAPLRWFGRLPGDIRLVGDNVALFIPITSMLLISLLINGILWLMRRGRRDRDS